MPAILNLLPLQVGALLNAFYVPSSEGLQATLRGQAPLILVLGQN